jgi:hypothetical protein
MLIDAGAPAVASAELGDLAEVDAYGRVVTVWAREPSFPAAWAARTPGVLETARTAALRKARRAKPTDLIMDELP